MTVGDVQLWITVPLLPARVTIPVEVQHCRARLRARDLAITDHPIDLDVVHVAFD